MGMETVADFMFWGSKITADGDCSHEIKRRLLLRRKVTTKLDGILKSRDIALPTKVHLVKAMIFPVGMYRCEICTIKKAAAAKSLQLCPTLCDPMNYSTPGLPVHHQLPEFTQTHVHWVSDAIQPSHPLSSTCPPVPNSTQHQSLPMSQLFTWSGQSIGVSALASFLPKKTQGWSPSEWTGWISLQSKGLARVFSNTTVQKHQFFGAQPSS